MQKGILVKVESIILLSKCYKKQDYHHVVLHERNYDTWRESEAHKETIYYGKMGIDLIEFDLK